MKKQLLLIVVLCLTTFAMNAQAAHPRKCATMKLLDAKIKNDPSEKQRIEQAEIRTQKWIATHKNFKSNRSITTIPVVVHVVYNTTTENISTAQIQSQIDVLNDDFRLMNSDSLPDTHPFWQFATDSQIEFCLAQRDPSGNSTTGITRTYTDSTSGFMGNGSEKFTATGGINNWDPTHYLNIWVVDLTPSGGTLGYATFPADLAPTPNEDGVVIHYQAFGNIGTAGTGTFTVNDGGRTATHEVGHWLNLHHIWGDAVCGDDLVADTEPAENNNFGCPSFPHNPSNTCGGSADGEMYMNYMDYVDDNCMNMFTIGQASRMDASLNGDRAGLLTSNGCMAVGIDELSFENNFEIFPNPSNGTLIINSQKTITENINLFVYNIIGSKIAQVENIKSFPYKLDLDNLTNGVYYLQINSGSKTLTKEIFISK